MSVGSAGPLWQQVAAGGGGVLPPDHLIAAGTGTSRCGFRAERPRRLDEVLNPVGHPVRLGHDIKTTARDAHSFRNPETRRLRTRCATPRRGRGHLNPA